MFATLDTTSRKFFVADGGAVVLSDTVGFIKHLPHTLVAAFRATLEEAVEADLLLHVVDASSPSRDQQIEEVNKVLAEIGADHIPQLMVLNKIDVTGWRPVLSGTSMVELAAFGSVRALARALICYERRWQNAAASTRLKQNRQ